MISLHTELRIITNPSAFTKEPHKKNSKRIKLLHSTLGLRTACSFQFKLYVEPVSERCESYQVTTQLLLLRTYLVCVSNHCKIIFLPCTATHKPTMLFHHIQNQLNIKEMHSVNSNLNVYFGCL